MKKIFIPLLLALGCGTPPPVEPKDSPVPQPTSSATVAPSPPVTPAPDNPNTSLDFLNCRGVLCSVVGAPVLLQTDPNLPASDPEMIQYSAVGCLETAIVVANTSALLNRTIGIIDTGTRGYQFDSLAAGYPYAVSGTQLLVWQYNALLDSTPKYNGFYFPELVNSFDGGLTAKYPADCVPTTAGSCWWGGNDAGDFYGYGVWDGVVLNNSIFIQRLQQKYMQVIAFQWTPNTWNGDHLTIEWNPTGHKIALVGFLTDGSEYPLLFSDPGSGQLTYGKMGVLNASDKVKMLAITNKGRWTANTLYAVGDSVSYMGSTYKAITAHTSTFAFDTAQWQAFDAPLNTWSYFEYRDDPNHGKWLMVADWGIRLY